MRAINCKSLLLTAGLLSLLLIGAPHAMSILNGKLPLTGPWKQRFQDVTKLNAYAKTQPVELSNVTIENHNIDGAVLNGGKFENTDWKEVRANKTTLTNVTFRRGILENIDFSHSTLTDVVFEDVKLRGIRFFHATLNNVRFVRCTFNGVNVDQTKNSRIEVSDSQAISTSFSEGQLIAVFRNSKLFEGVEITDLLPPSSLTFEKSELKAVDMSRSKLDELTIVESNMDHSALTFGSVDKLDVKGSVLASVSFRESTIKSATIRETKIGTLVFFASKITSMSIAHCTEATGLAAYQATIGALMLNRCSLDDLSLLEAKIGTLQIQDGSISNSMLKRMEANSAVFENISFGGAVNFTAAKVRDLKTHNISKQPGLNLITTGSNVKF